MSNSWLRLWHDMPNDPKWRTIARISNQPIALVKAVYLHLLVDASRNVTRGHVDVTTEDLASALDVSESDISDILNAMQGRVLDGQKVSGWDKRQPKREDAGSSETGAKSSTQRKREQRERDRDTGNVTGGHDMSRNVTTDTDKEEDKTPPKSPKGDWIGFADFYSAYPKHESRQTALKAWNKLQPDELLRRKIFTAVARWSKSEQWTKDRGQFIPLPATWLNGRRWEDEPPADSAPDTAQRRVVV